MPELYLNVYFIDVKISTDCYAVCVYFIQDHYRITLHCIDSFLIEMKIPEKAEKSVVG